VTRLLSFALFLTVALSVFFGLHAYILKRLSGLYDFPTTLGLWLVLGAAVLLFPAPSILSTYVWNRPIQAAYVASMVYLGAVWLAFALLAVYHPVQYLLPATIPAARLLFPLLLVGLVVAGLVNAGRLRAREYTVPAPGLEKAVRVAQISDVHLGAAHGRAALQRLVDTVRAGQPDFVVITGDLFDGSGRVTADTLAPLDDLETPTFLVLGNHEMYTDLSDTLRLVAQGPLRLLRNEAIDHAGLRLVGIDNIETGRETKLTERLAAIPPEPGQFTLLLFHQPMPPTYLAAHGIGLQLAGHTHAGQIFPFNFLVRLLYPADRGLHEAGGAYLHVSPGSGTWGPPMRLGSTSEVTFLDLQPE
jgi:uncharacterized protein